MNNPDPILDAVLPAPASSAALDGALRAARHRRRVRHTLTVSPLLVAGAFAALLAIRQQPTAAPPTPSVAIEPVAPLPAAAFTVSTDDTLTIPVVRTRPVDLPPVTDDALLAIASAPGKPAALITQNGRTTLITTPGS